MEVIDPKVEITSPMSPEIGQAMIEHIERIARTCYKSNHLIKEGSAYKFTKHACAIGHTSVIEHASISVKFTCSRAASHQIVRHRMASYAQESQRYCNYSKDQFGKSVVFIRPEFIRNGSGSVAANERESIWTSMMEKDEEAYYLVGIKQSDIKCENGKNVIDEDAYANVLINEKMISSGQTRADLENLGFIFKMSFYKNDIIEFEKDGVIYRERFLSRTKPQSRNYIETKPSDCAKYEKQRLIGLGKTQKIIKYRMDILGNLYACESERFSRYC